MDIWKNQGGQNRTNNYGICNFNKVISSNIHTSTKVDISLSYTDDLFCNNVRVLNNLNVNNDLSINNLYVGNDLSTNNCYVVNDFSTNNCYVVNDFSTNNCYVENNTSTSNLHVVNDLSTSNCYVVNDFSTNNYYVANDISTNNLYVTNDLSVNNNLKVNNTTNFNKLIVDKVSRNNLIINNDISFNSDKILITSKENGITNTRKLEILNDGRFCILNESNHKIYDFRSGFIIKHVINSLTINSSLSTQNQYNLYTQIDISKNVGSDIGVVFLSQTNVSSGTSEDSYAAKIKITPQSGTAINDEYVVVYKAGSDDNQSNAARGLCGLNCLNFTSDNANIRSSSHLNLKVYFKFLNEQGGQTDDALTIKNGRWIIACDPVNNSV